MDNSNVNNLGLQNGLESHRLFDQLVNHRRQPEELLGLAGVKLVKVPQSIAEVSQTQEGTGKNPWSDVVQ